MSSSDCTARVRFLHNVAGAPNVDVYLNEKALVLNLSYTELTAYLSTRSGKSRLVVKVSGSDTVLLNKKIRLYDDSPYTAIIAGEITALENLLLLVYRDDNQCPDNGQSKVRFIHAAAGVPDVDVYAGDVKVFSDVSYTETGNPVYLQTGAGWVDLSVNVAGTDNTVVGPLAVFLESGGIYTIVASGTGSPDFPLTAVLSRDNPLQCETLQKNFGEDIQRYMGEWWQIASIPQFFGQQCARQKAAYTLLQDDVKVFNTCLNSEGGIVETISGTATIVNPLQPAALRVEFPGFPQPQKSSTTNAHQSVVVDLSLKSEASVRPSQDQIPRPPPGANYLVHRTDYDQYALVGSPDRNSLFILSRKRKMSEDAYNKLVRYAERLGYDVSRLVVDEGAVC